MVNNVPMSRSRAALSGLALVLLGAWGGLMLFVGPYFHFGYGPDKTWVYDAARLYAAVVPGGVAVVTGLVIIATRSRWLSGACAVIAALAGAWFVIGRQVLAIVVSDPLAYAIGNPINGLSAHRQVMTDLATFTGTGILVVLFAALALGRVSIGAYKDFLRFGDAAAGAGASPAGVGGLASVGLAAPRPSFTPYQPTSVSPTLLSPASASPFPPAPEPVVGGQAKFPSQYPATGPAAGEDTAAQSGAATNRFTPAGQVTYSPGQTRYPPVRPVQEPTNPLTAPTQEQKPPGQ